MPKREAGEKLSDFIGRFVGSKREEKKFPQVKLRSVGIRGRQRVKQRFYSNGIAA